MSHNEKTFAHILREGIDRSGKTLAHIVEELRDAGSSISQASLSYWQSGRSVPRRTSSGKTLRALEKILNLPDNALLNAASAVGMTYEPEAAATFENTSRGLVVPAGSREILEDTDSSRIDWANEVERKAMRTNVTIGNDGHLVVVKTLCIVALSGIDAPVFHVGNVWSEGNPPPELLEVIGGKVGDKIVYPEDNYSLREIHLPKGFSRGELRQVGWTYRQESRERVTRTAHRWFARPLETYALTINFADSVPERVEWVQTQETVSNGFSQRVETSRELEVKDGIARLALEDVHDCTAFVRWYW